MNKLKIDEFVSSVEEQVNGLLIDDLPDRDKVELYILGQSHQNLFKILGDIFFIEPKHQMNGFFVNGFECEFLYGENIKVFQVASVGKKEIDFVYLSNLLSQFDNAQSNLKFEFIINNDILKKVNVHVIVSDNDYSDVEWNAIFKDADFILFTLTSTALLSMCERKILRSTLLQNMKNDLGVLLTNSNMILPEDRIDIDTSLTSVFGAYETPIFRFPEEDKENFVKYLKTMTSRIDELQMRRKKRAKHIMLTEIMNEVQLKINILSADNMQLDEVIELLNEKLQKLPDRKESACRRARMKYTSKLRLELVEAVSNFHQQFKNVIETEIESNDSIEELSDILPGYITSQWENEAVFLSNRIKEFSEFIRVEIKDYINDDIISYIEKDISENFASYIFEMTKMYMHKNEKDITASMPEQNFNYEVKKDNAKLGKYGMIVSGVALTLMSHPLLGIAAVTLGSKKVYATCRECFVNTNKQSLLDASKEMCGEFYKEMDLWIEQTIRDIEKYLEDCISECYQNVIDLMLETVKDKRTNFIKYDEDINALCDIKEKIEVVLDAVKNENK